MNISTSLLVITFIIVILFFEKPKLLASMVHNIKSIKSIIKNIIVIAPLIMFFINSEHILSKFNFKSKNIETKTFDDFEKIKKKKLRRVSEPTKKIVASSQKWKCSMCQNLLDYSYEIDHKIPLFKGGSNNIENLQALCPNCHRKKTMIDRINN